MVLVTVVSEVSPRSVCIGTPRWQPTSLPVQHSATRYVGLFSLESNKPLSEDFAWTMRWVQSS